MRNQALGSNEQSLIQHVLNACASVFAQSMGNQRVYFQVRNAEVSLKIQDAVVNAESSWMRSH